MATNRSAREIFVERDGLELSVYHDPGHGGHEVAVFERGGRLEPGRADRSRSAAGAVPGHVSAARSQGDAVLPGRVAVGHAVKQPRRVAPPPATEIR